MNIKYSAFALVVAATLFSQTVFASSTTPQRDDCSQIEEDFTPRQGNKLMKQHQQRRDQMWKAHKNFKKAETELLKSLPGLDKEAAAEKINEFYTGVFSKIPMRSPRIITNIVSEIQEMDIPEDIKAKVITKIEDYPQARVKRMQTLAIGFAEKMLDLPPAEREDAIINFNNFVVNYALHGNNRHHKMREMCRGRNGMQGMKGRCNRMGMGKRHSVKNNCMKKGMSGMKYGMQGMNGRANNEDMPRQRKFKHHDGNGPHASEDCPRSDCPRRADDNPQPEEE